MVSVFGYYLRDFTIYELKMSIDHQIYQVAAKIAAKGKTPTVALIKAGMPKGTPLAKLISGLQYWQNNPTAPEPIEEATEENSGMDVALANYIDQQISAAIKPLQQKISELEKQLEQMTKK